MVYIIIPAKCGFPITHGQGIVLMSSKSIVKSKVCAQGE